MVVGGGARHGSAAGPPQSREGSPDERARPGCGQLALALYRGHAVGTGVRVAATTDDGIAPRRGSGVVSRVPRLACPWLVRCDEALAGLSPSPALYAGGARLGRLITGSSVGLLG